MQWNSLFQVDQQVVLETGSDKQYQPIDLGENGCLSSYSAHAGGLVPKLLKLILLTKSFNQVHSPDPQWTVHKKTPFFFSEPEPFVYVRRIIESSSSPPEHLGVVVTFNYLRVYLVFADLLIEHYSPFYGNLMFIDKSVIPRQESRCMSSR